MLYRKMEKTGDSLSILGFGAMRLPEKNGKIDEKRATAQIHYAINNGVNYIDTAFPYHMGESEPFLGRALAGGYREKIRLATKLPQWLVKGRNDMDDFINLQLEKLKTDSIDYYLIHALDGGRWDKLKEFGIFDFLEKIKKDGRAKHTGFSFHGALPDFKRIIDDHDWDFCQIQYNILDEKNQAGKEGLQYASSKGLGVVVMEPLRGGMLVNNIPKDIDAFYNEAAVKRSPAQWSLKWIWNHPEVTVVLSGMNDERQIEENIRAAGQSVAGELKKDEIEMIDKVKARYRELMKVNCTGCRYCMPCPRNVNIPMCFEIYNTRFLMNNKMKGIMEYAIRMGGAMNKKGFASQCIECGKCEKHCPQGISIIKELKNVKKEFEGIFLVFINIIVGMFINGQRKSLNKKNKNRA